MADETFKPIGTLMPNWMINSVDRIMDFYIGKYLNCDPVILDRPPAPEPGHQYLLYAHIPFCKTLCSYCTFHRFLFKEHKAREYFVNLRKEMDYVKALGYDFTSMYIGGGNFVHASTPSTGVRVNSLNETYYNTRYIGARRII